MRLPRYSIIITLTLIILLLSNGVIASTLSLEQLIAMLEHEQPEMRLSAITQLMERNLVDDYILVKLVDLLDDSDYNVSQAANKALAACGLRAVSHLAEGLFSKYTSADKITVRQNICRILGQIEDEETVEVLISTLSDPSPQVRRAAALALEQIGPTAVKSSEPLARLLLNREEDAQVRAAAAQALGKVGYDNNLAVFALSIARVEKAFQVVWAAQGALNQLNIDTEEILFAILKQAENPEYAKLASDALVHFINTSADGIDILQEIFYYEETEDESEADSNDEIELIQMVIAKQLARSFNGFDNEKKTKVIEILQTGLLSENPKIQLIIAKNLAGASKDAASLQKSLIDLVGSQKNALELRRAAIYALEWVAKPDSAMFNQLITLAFERHQDQAISETAIRTIAQSRLNRPEDIWPLLAYMPFMNDEQLWLISPLIVEAGEKSQTIIQELTNLAIDGDNRARLLAIRCLSALEVGAKMAIPVLLDIIYNDTEQELRIAAIRALVQIGEGTQDLDPFLEDFALDYNPNVQRIALQGLGRWKASPPEKVLAFPTAQGFGAWTPGGRGGKIYIVTNLNDKGPGSLREAVEASGSRIVLFNVSGTIFLESDLKIQNPYITIAGQSAPGHGITIANHETSVETHDVIIRHLRFRLGDQKRAESDALGVNGANNVIIDHVSASWGMDETLSVSESDNVTVQWSFITESMKNSYHSKGPHGYGSLVRGGYGAKYSFINNLWAHHMGRMPRPGNYNNYLVDPEGLFVDFRNNVFYNWGGNVAGANNDKDSVTKYNFINNYYIRGYNSTGSYAFREYSTKAQAYFAGNYMNGIEPSDPWSLVDVQISWNTFMNYYKQEQPFESGHVTTVSAPEAYELVLANAGAQPRDAIDQRVQESVINRTGRHIDSQHEVGGFLEIQLFPPDKDSNNDGIPDWWYVKHGFNPSVGLPTDLDLNGDGYTIIEEYLNGTNPDVI